MRRTLCLVWSTALAACTARGAPAPVPPAPHPVAAPACSPCASPAPASSEPRFQPAPPPPDEHAHGATVTSRWAPYAEDEVRRLGLAPARVLATLFPDGAPSPVDAFTPLPAFIGSTAHITGDWTYFTSATVLVYQVAPIKLRAGRAVLVLYSRSLPGRMTVDVLDAEWRLALVDREVLRSDVAFRTRIKHDERGLWDMIYADLAVDAGAKVTITYAHTGSGGGRDQTFEARFRIDREAAKVALLNVRQTRDGYP